MFLCAFGMHYIKDLSLNLQWVLTGFGFLWAFGIYFVNLGYNNWVKLLEIRA